jgi:hypothetical protein
MLRNQRTLDMYADLADKPHVAIEHMPPEPKHRKPRDPEAGPPAVPLEKDVMAEIITQLRLHPMIGLVERVNSGSAVEQNRDGSKRYISFNAVYTPKGCAVRLASVDIQCTLRGGKRFVIEVKRPGWKSPHGEREERQAAYIDHIISLGGYGMFATSWDQVWHRLNEITAAWKEGAL